MIYHNTRGFVLLEIVLAIALFSFVATAMVIALDRLTATSNITQKEALIFRRMNSVMTEYAWRAEPGKTTLPTDTNGVSVSVAVEPANYLSSNGTRLADMFRIEVTGRLDTEPDVVRKLERTVYSPKTL